MVGSSSSIINYITQSNYNDNDVKPNATKATLIGQVTANATSIGHVPAIATLIGHVTDKL